MREYPKILNVFKRDPAGRLLSGQFSCPEFEFLAPCQWEYTEKVDGTNIRVMWDGENVRLGGKTDRAQTQMCLLARLQDLFYSRASLEWFASFGATPVCLYGEGYGAGIQKGGENYKSDGVDFVLFDVWVGGIWLRRPDVNAIAKSLGIQAVPVLGTDTLPNIVGIVADGLGSQWGPFPAEGVVARPCMELFTRRGERIIAKIKRRDLVALEVAVTAEQLARAA